VDLLVVRTQGFKQAEKVYQEIIVLISIEVF